VTTDRTSGFVDKMKVKYSGIKISKQRPARGSARAVALPRSENPDAAVPRRRIDELAEHGLGVLLLSSETEELVDGSHRILVLWIGRS
jgi:hypothetical protein